ncbi:MAG TPA: kelch repeat-containing protein [Gaiellaceae bacterium]|nr:kelch repeat-containing protein [Gaiellaceae bacterium]
MRLALGAAAAVVGAFVLFFTLAADGAETAEAAGWEQVASLSQRRSYIASAQLGDRIFAAGGMVGETGRPLAVFTRYDAKADEWTVLPQLPVATRAAAAAGVGDTLYVIGGTTPAGNTDAVWAWDGRRWSERAQLPSPRFNHAAAAIGTEIYVFGGFREGKELRDVLVYDTVADTWRASTPLPRANHAFDVVVFHGELWVIGGRRGEEVLREVQILDPRTGRWRQGPAMPKPMELLGAAVVGEGIHAVWESTYQIYDARTKEWSDGPRPGVTRHALQTFYVGGALYTVGGCTTALRDSPIVERRRL